MKDSSPKAISNSSRIINKTEGGRKWRCVCGVLTSCDVVLCLVLFLFFFLSLLPLGNAVMFFSFIQKRQIM